MKVLVHLVSFVFEPATRKVENLVSNLSESVSQVVDNPPHYGD